MYASNNFERYAQTWLPYRDCAQNAGLHTDRAQLQRHAPHIEG
jgi:hypothetical protein